MYISPEALQVFLERFEGPLDLLLYLIRKQNLDILTIPMAKITDQYMSYINNMQVLNIDLAAEYLLMAAMLIAIKSRMLLPKPEITSSEEETDPRQELIDRLLEYEKIKHGAELINSLPLADRDFFWLNVKVEECKNILPDIVLEDLQKAWRNLLLRAKPLEQHHIKRQELSVREHMAHILRTLNKIKQISFIELFELNSGVQVIVVNFIAVLELTKEGLVGIYRDENNIMVKLS